MANSQFGMISTAPPSSGFFCL